MNIIKIIKDILVPKYIHHRNYITKGLSEINMIRYIIMTVAGILVIAKLSTEISAFWYKVLAITAGVGMVVGCWIIGWGWDKIKGYDYENDWTNLRNPFARDVTKALVVKKNTRRTKK